MCTGISLRRLCCIDKNLPPIDSSHPIFAEIVRIDRNDSCNLPHRSKGHGGYQRQFRSIRRLPLRGDAEANIRSEGFRQSACRCVGEPGDLSNYREHRRGRDAADRSQQETPALLLPSVSLLPPSSVEIAMEVLRLMGHCNNKCFFCMVEEEIATGKDIPLDILKSRIEKIARGTAVDLFGGEPTLYPHFFELLEYLHDEGVSFHIATNGRRFSDVRFAQKVAEFSPVLVRTSLYGSDGDTHDSLTRTRGSFSETLLGIQNMVKLNMSVSVNFLIFRNNCGQILRATEILTSMGVNDFKYSVPVRTGGFVDALSTIETIRTNLLPALDYLHSLGAKFVIEKAPLCLAPKYIQDYFMESTPEMLSNLSQIFLKAEVCNECVLATYCPGIERGYFSHFGEAGLVALDWDDLPPNVIHNLTLDELLAFQSDNCFELFRVTDEDSLFEPENVNKLLNLVRENRLRGRVIGLVV